MKKELFSELQKSMEQALAHSQGKIILRKSFKKFAGSMEGPVDLSRRKGFSAK
jgi:hypothetical protein